MTNSTNPTRTVELGDAALDAVSGGFYNTQKGFGFLPEVKEGFTATDDLATIKGIRVNTKGFITEEGIEIALRR